MLSTLGEITRSLRLERNIVLADMAHALNLSSVQLSDIEHGRLTPPPDFADRIAKNLIPPLSDDELPTLAHAAEEAHRTASNGGHEPSAGSPGKRRKGVSRILLRRMTTYLRQKPPDFLETNRKRLATCWRRMGAMGISTRIGSFCIAPDAVSART
jgi:transcriptional regulator with XRE-family HTH domain